ncbi:hypothetical protein COC42_00055 [Sphingomonas spermidinifaciens]|uniref:DUF3617 domain-containing protein n=2 Tax=Sphingomonas spermidinifaciens TaxID=1141889 RepID=A0A2A4BAB5_9SPHN|nr:hypothetical protein COC42_00055 [Sphingomonas spermidinifaciens]
MVRGYGVLAGALLAMGAGLAAAAPAQAPALKVLAQIEPGRWQLREIDSKTERAVCVSDPRILIQLHHGAAQCSRFIVDNQATTGTVHYTCSGAGHGRTTIAVETPRLVQIRTQGLANGLPFQSEIEARRLGSC